MDARNYYRLILVDDEDEVRGRISSKISEESGFQVVGTAGNGHDALELIEECSPHVIITDIRMPYIDGIELARIIRREYPTIRMAFITGYDEFDYAREAVDLGVRCYLTKPLTQKDISRFLDSLKKELDDEFRQHSDWEQMKTRNEESLPLLIENHFSAFLSSSPGEGESDVKDLMELGIRLHKVSMLILVELERNEANPDIFLKEKKKITTCSSIGDIFQRRHISCYHFNYRGGLVFILEKGESSFAAQLDEALLESVQTAQMYHSTCINIGVSTAFRGFDELRRAYLEACRALADSKFLNTGRIIYIDQLENNNPVAVPELDVKDLEYIVRFGTDDELISFIETERSKMKPGITKDFRLYMLTLLNIAVGFASSVSVDINTINGADVLETLRNLSGIDQILDWFYTLVLRIRREKLQERMDNSRKMLKNAIAYMNANFTHPDLSLDNLCDAVGISVSYLSLLFKKHTGQSFVKNLTHLRLEKAKELLRYSGNRIIEIAEECGYRDVYYFSHSFKKNEGLSPRQYREKNQAP